VFAERMRNHLSPKGQGGLCASNRYCHG
jgi:hypothetical protein